MLKILSLRFAKFLFKISRLPHYLYWSSYHRLLGPFAFRKVGRRVKFHGKVRIEYPFSAIFLGDSTLVGIGCYFSATRNGRIVIGDNTCVNDFCYITSNYLIEIGKNVLIGELVSIRDFDHEFSRLDIPVSEQGLTGAAIKIGDGTWIGRGVMVTSGVTIGTGCIIGANSVVTRDIPDWSVAVGVPCRVLRSRKATTKK